MQKKDDLLNYYNKSMPIDMGENRITFLTDPQKILMELIEVFLRLEFLQLQKI